jgi:hypothetical protein
MNVACFIYIIFVCLNNCLLLFRIILKLNFFFLQMTLLIIQEQKREGRTDLDHTGKNDNNLSPDKHLPRYQKRVSDIEQSVDPKIDSRDIERKSDILDESKVITYSATTTTRQVSKEKLIVDKSIKSNEAVLRDTQRVITDSKLAVSDKGHTFGECAKKDTIASESLHKESEPKEHLHDKTDHVS